jgi:glycosyltransferase involved in cell wall biosynthesis
MKLGFVYDSFLPNIGGIEVIMLHLGTELVKRGYDVTVFTRNAVQYKRAALRPTEYINGILVKRLGTSFPPSISLDPRIVSDLISLNFDLIHAFSYHFAFNFVNIASLVSILKKKPLVATPIYNPIRAKFYRTFSSKVTTLLFDQNIGPRILKKANLVTALSKSEADFYRQHGISNLRIIPEGVYISKPPLENVVRFKEKYGLIDKVILAVGRLESYKGQDLLLKAFQIVLKYFPKAKLLIVGKDWGKLAELEKIVEEGKCNKNVIFTGSISETELECAYESADVVVHPSLFETFTRIALEAWSHKKPIICFDLGGPTEFITAETGILVKYRDVDSLGRMIIKLLSDEELSKAMGENGYLAVKSKYLWSKIVKEYELVYELATRANRQTILNDAIKGKHY